MNTGTLLLTWMLALVAGAALGPWWRRAWLGLVLTGATFGAAAAGRVLLGDGSWDWTGALLLGGQAPHLRLDALSAIFFSLLNVVGGLGAWYAQTYWADEVHPRSAPRGRFWWCAMLLSMGGVLIASNGLHFLIAWELFAICSYFLITLERTRPAVRAAGWLFLAASHAGTLALFAFFALLASRTGNWNLGPQLNRPELAPLFWFALAGFGIKAGLFPLHIWLPSAHANAPSHVSGLMSGVALKLGVYGLIRFGGWLPVPTGAGWVVAGLGAWGALLGIAFAFAQNNLKRLLAYCSVENIGIIAVGFGAALLAKQHGDSAWGSVLLAGALLHVWNHGLFKSLLFFCAGSVLHATGTREVSRLGGLWRAMPWTAALFAFGSAAISGLPPLNGFVSEWLVYLGLFNTATRHAPSAWASLLATVLLAMAGALALATFVKAGATVFLGAPRTKAATHAHEAPIGMRAPLVVLAIACAAIGLAPTALWPLLERAVDAWNPGWNAVDAAPPLATLSRIDVALAGAFILGAAAVVSVVRRRGVRRGLTWDCGYAAPSSRMQYTGGSFAAIVAGWFRWILQPQRRLRRPRGPFPEHAVEMKHFPETVLDHVLQPLGNLLLLLAGVARQLQHGRLPFYIVYVFGGLIVLALLVSIP